MKLDLRGIHGAGRGDLGYLHEIPQFACVFDVTQKPPQGVR